MDIKPNTVGFARDVGELNQTKFKPNPPYSFGSLVVYPDSSARLARDPATENSLFQTVR